MMENDGFIAGNYFSDRDHILEVMSELSTMVPDFYIAPFWFTRYEEDIAGKDVYADTIYVPCIEDLTVKNDKIIKPLFKFLEADELFIVTGKSGQKYIRIWWD